MKLFLALILTFNVNALPLDAKFLGRILGSSDSKRTLLVNRGEEHGLKKGDHAKISLPSGMVARAVVVKVSPGRSVWSIYRFFEQAKIQNNIVYTFKIARQVKLTSDETKTVGALAKEQIKKREKIPTNQISTGEKIKQNKIKRELFNKEKKLSKLADGVDYSKLEAAEEPSSKRDISIDWSKLDDKDKHDQFQQSVDYSSLH